jgi:hypothetical protein
MRKVLVVVAVLGGTAAAEDKVREVQVDGYGLRVRITTKPEGGSRAEVCGADECSLLVMGSGEVDQLDVVDLEGAPRSLEGPLAYRLEAKGMKRPAIFARTVQRRHVTTKTRYSGEVTGDDVRRELVLYSLANGHVFSTTVENRGPGGDGMTTSVSLVRASSGRVLDLVAVEQHHLENKSHCLQPKPATTRYKFVDGRYVAQNEAHALGGCGR